MDNDLPSSMTGGRPTPRPSGPRSSRVSRRGVAVAVLAALLLAAATGARAQRDDSATVKLIQILIAKGILTKDQAASLLSQAQSEAHSNQAARTPAKAGAPSLATAAPPEEPQVPKGTVRVTYVPQSVRDQIAQQVRDQVLGEEQKNGWAAPNEVPDWIHRITVYGDLRTRYERVLQDPANKTSVANSTNFPFVDFNAINTGSPFDVNYPQNQVFPTINTTEDRTLYQIRARLGVKSDITDWLKGDIRLATGNDNSPVSENQTLGNNTNFGKYNIWLDRAYALLHAPPEATNNILSTAQLFVGKFANPFWTTDLQYSDDLNFDGAAVQLVSPVRSNFHPWLSAGAFQVYDTAYNYQNAVQSYDKVASRDKYLFGLQAGVDYKPTPVVVTKFAAAWFDYQNVQGELSSPCVIFSDADVCDTDNSRPQFAQFGNTYFPIRNIVAGNPTLQPPLDPQYFGLASKFDIVDLHGQMVLTRYHPVDVSLEGEWSENLGFNRASIEAKGPQNNLGSVPTGAPAGTPAPFIGGNTAWMLKLEVGTQDIVKRNQWNWYFGYKYLASDAVLDAFTDSNFHTGGTNAKGYFTGVDYGIARNTYIAARVLSANQVSGPTYRNDVIQVDLNTKF